MRILQVTNLISHHQLPLAHQLASIVGVENFRFAAISPPDPERIQLGWNTESTESWILRAGEREEDRLQFESWWDKADVVICGERFFKKMQDRLNHSQLCFYMSERWWKPPIGVARLLHPGFLKTAINFRKISESRFFHYLAIGPYAEKDIQELTDMKDRLWRWGYFTDVPKQTKNDINCGNAKGSFRIIWAGRMLNWKRLDTLIKSLSELQRRKVEFNLTLIGDGPERIRLQKLSEKLLNPSSYHFHDTIPASQVNNIMSQHNVYVLPSNNYEGWGAVINEAMSSGCTVVASYGAGAAAAMIDDGINGLLFKPGDWRKLSSQLIRLADDDSLRQRLAKEALHTVQDIWSPKVVAERFHSVCEALLSKHDVPIYTKGPLSRAGY